MSDEGFVRSEAIATKVVVVVVVVAAVVAISPLCFLVFSLLSLHLALP